MRGRPRTFELLVDEEERHALERMVRSTNGKAGLARRAAVVLCLASGQSETATAERLGMGDNAVRRWGMRFTRERLAGLEDRPRPGRPRRFSP